MTSIPTLAVGTGKLEREGIKTYSILKGAAPLEAASFYFIHRFIAKKANFW